VPRMREQKLRIWILGRAFGEIFVLGPYGASETRGDESWVASHRH